MSENCSRCGVNVDAPGMCFDCALKEPTTTLEPFGGTRECPIETGPYDAWVNLANEPGYEVFITGPRHESGGTLDHYVKGGFIDLENRKELARIECHRLNRAYRLGHAAMTTAGRPATAGKLRAAAAILSASRPAPGYLRASEGADMRLLGTLPVTADGCVVGIGAELWCNAEEHGVFQWGSPPWVETSDAGWVFIDRDGADVAPQFMYSTRTAAESAKGGHHAE